MMKVKIKVCKEETPNNSWYEIYEINNDIDPQKWGEELVEKYNIAIPIRGGEKRLFLGSEIISESYKHKWVKTSIVGIVTRGKIIYDTYKCANCGITGKMYGIGQIQRDSRYKAKKFESCNPNKLKN